LIVAPDVAVSVSVPVASTLEFRMKARTSAGVRTSARLQPIRLRASDAPTEAPSAPPPTAMEIEAATTVALIVAPVSVALRVVEPPLLTTLPPSMCALALVRMTLVASAPAPLRPAA